MEKRKYVRQPLDLDAWITVEAGDRHLCQVRDFSLGGVFVACSSLRDDGSAASERSVVEQQPVQLHFSAESKGTQQQYRLSGRLARILKAGVAIEFVDPDPGTLLVMQELANQAHKTFLETRALEAAREKATGGKSSEEASDRIGIMEALKELVSDFLTEEVEELFRDANQRLFESARDAPNNVEQAACLDAMKEVENIQSIAEPAFLEAVLDHVAHLGEPQLVGPDAQSQLDGEQLTLVDTEKFQDWLLVKHILEKAEPKYKDTQFELFARLSAVSDTRIDEYNNPIGPLGICGSFYDSVQDLGASRVARKAVFDALESTVVSDLGMLYDDVNGMFVKRGILPTVEKPKLKVPKKPRAATPQGANQPVSPGAPEVPTPEGVPDPGQAYANPAAYPAGAPAPQGSWPDPSQTGADVAYPGGAPSAPPPPAAAVPAGQPAYPSSGTPPAPSGFTPPSSPPGAAAPAAQPVYPPSALGPQPSPAGSVAGSANSPAPAASSYAAHAGGAPAGSAPAGPGGGSATPADTSAQTVVPGTEMPSSGTPQPVTSAPSYGAQPMVSAYQTVHTLLGLQRQTGWTGQAPASAPPPGTAPGAGSPTTEAPGPTYDRGEIVNVLSSIQPVSGGGSGPGRTNLRERIQSALEAQQPTGVSKQLGETENNAIDLTSGLVESIVEDALVSDKVRSQLKRLEVPLLRAAMENQGFFADANHPARRVVDQLGAINIPKDEAGAKLQHKVDQVIGQITSREGDGASEFVGAVEELDSVVREQVEAYEKNVRGVVEACERQEAIMGAMRKDRPAGDAENTGRKALQEMPEEWRQWLDRARRLQVGDRVAIERGGRTHQEALAWVSDDQDSYVFVDSVGNKASSMIRQELAMQLRRGLVQVLEEAAVPAMERGMHMIMRQVHEKLVNKATQDSTTGLLNRKAFVDRVRRAIIEANQTHSEHVLCHLDLDHFGEINEKWGRRAGDRLLARFGIVLQKNMGGKGVTARLGEDEFGLVLEGYSQERGQETADRLRRAIGGARVFWKGESLPLSVSIGLVSITERSESVAVLMEAAEAACAKAKEAGRDRVEVFQPEPGEMDAGSDTADALEDVAKMLEGDRLQLKCQRVEPIGDDGETKPHYEILLGVRDEKGNLVSPEPFIRLAERSDKVTEVDRWVIRKALQWMAKNKRRLLQLGGCSINLSGVSLNDESLTQYVLDQFMETKVPPGKVLFEVTETAAIERLSTAEEFLRVMKDFGCRFSLDDFGTGHSSYEYLRHLPVDYVKIDGMFVKELETNPNDYAMVKSITEIGHFMGKKTIAEFVENEAILDKIKEIGVDFAQGYGVEKPMLLQELS